MRAFDCSDPSHGKVHFTGKDDDDLVQSVKAHAATWPVLTVWTEAALFIGNPPGFGGG